MKELLFIIIIPFALAYVGAYMAGGKEALGFIMAISSVPVAIFIARFFFDE